MWAETQMEITVQCESVCREMRHVHELYESANVSECAAQCASLVKWCRVVFTRPC